MDRFKRIAHRGWLRRFLSVATFGYYPNVYGFFYTLQADVECRFLASGNSEFRGMASGDSAARMTSAADVEL